MGTFATGRPPVTDDDRLCDELEQSLFALAEAQAKFDEAEALEGAAMAAIREARDRHIALLTKHGYRHLATTVPELDQQIKRLVQERTA